MATSKMKAFDTNELIVEMIIQNNIWPFCEIVADNTRHICEAWVNDTFQWITYTVTEEPFGKEGPFLICSYGLINDENQYTYVAERN